MVIGKVSHKVGSTWILRNRRLPSRVVAGDSSIFGVLASYPLCVLRVRPRVLRVLRYPRSPSRQSVKIGLTNEVTPHHMVSAATLPRI